MRGEKRRWVEVRNDEKRGQVEASRTEEREE